MADNCVNKNTGKLKRVLEGETIGYAKSDDLRVFFASDVQAQSKLEGGSADDHPTNFVLLEGVLVVQKGFADVELTPNMFPINPGRVLDDSDKKLLLPIPEWYVPCPNVMNIARLVSDSEKLTGARPFRNIMFRGPAGSGKTEGAKVLSSMFGSPYGVVTGHAEMEFFDLTSSLIPNTDSQMSTDGEMYEFLSHALRESGMKLPSFLDVATMPDAIFEQITGVANEYAGEAECLAALVVNLMKVCKQDKSMFCGETSKFKTVQSDLAMGFQKGWLVELQEMNTILKPGVLVGLNGILEYGRLRLPTGEVITRHPDTVIVFTQNVGYAGTTDGNQSVYSRIELKCDLDHPTEDEMVSRIMMHVPEIKEQACRTIVQAVIRVQQNCASEIEGGSVGTREALNWAKATVLLGGDMRSAAELTVLPSVGEDPDDIALVRTDIFQTVAEME
jgi:MoxR-like ATPase